MDNQQESLLNGYVPIIGYDKYFINKSGEIISYMRGFRDKLCTKKPPDTSGYIRIALGAKSEQKRYLLHRLVYFSFNPDDDQSLEINHIDGNKLNNNLDNLELVTRSENAKHAFSIGLKTSSGEKNSRAILTEDQVIEIYHRLLSGEGNITLAKEFGVTPSVIGKIKVKHNWYYLLKDLPDIPMKSKKPPLSEDQVMEVCELLLLGHSCPYIARRTGFASVDQVQDIKRKRTHRSITDKILN